MSARPYSLAWVAIPLALFVVVPAVTACGSDSSSCEDAFAKLAECCPRFTRHARCKSECRDYSYSWDGKAGVTATFPAISGPESDCILAATCEDLRQRGVCGRALGLEDRYRDSVTSETSARPHPSSCDEDYPEPAGPKLCL
ncbi:MAG: hypothetical protein HOO96_01170 [Polyangiaceae bacterium]|nr:hypothetical protein [Polyangiaceae bacterium]